MTLRNAFGDLLIAYRRDAETSPVNDGEITSLSTNENGRLKVSTTPAAGNPTTGNITAVKATQGTPVAGGTVSMDVQRVSNVTIMCSGTFSGVNCTFEASLDDTTWFAVQAIRTNANTIELTTGVLSAAPVYAWELSVNGYKTFRVRCTARTSGTQVWTFTPGAFATEPIPAAQISGTQPVSGTVALGAGTATVGRLVQNIFRISVVSAGLTTATTAYTSGDVLGTEFSFTSAASTTAWGGVVLSASLLDLSLIVHTGDVELWLFTAASTPAADNAALNWSDANMVNHVGIITFPTAGWKVTPSNAVNNVTGISIPYICAATTLFGTLVTRQANAVFTAVTDLRVTLSVARD